MFSEIISCDDEADDIDQEDDRDDHVEIEKLGCLTKILFRVKLRSKETTENIDDIIFHCSFSDNRNQVLKTGQKSYQ